MAKNDGWYAIVKGYREQIKNMRMQIASAENISKLVAEIFVSRARGRLEKYANTDNLGLISRLKSNIYYRPSKSGYQIIIRQDPEGLMTYLEYGTGLFMGASPHPEANKIGWTYGGNAGSSQAYKTVNGRFGWFFRTEDPDTYIDRNDSDRREGGTLVFTQGIKPIRYIYNTRKEIEDLITRSKGDYVWLEKELIKLQGEAL